MTLSNVQLADMITAEYIQKLSDPNLTFEQEEILRQKAFNYLENKVNPQDEKFKSYIDKRLKEITNSLNPSPDTENMAKGKFWETVSNFFKSMFASVWNGFEAKNISIWQKIAKLLNSFYIKILNNDKDMSFGVYRDLGFLNQESIEAIKKLTGNVPGTAPLTHLLLSISLITNVMQNVVAATGGDFRKKWFAAFTPALAAPQEILRGFFIAPEKTADLRKKCRENGYADEDIDLMLLANYNTFEWTIVQQLFWRKIISRDEAVVYLRELGYTDKRIQQMMSSWELIPPPSDILMMVGKEAFEPDQIAKYGLLEEFPDQQVEWLEKQGLNRFWQEKYWISHWNYPSPGQVLEMLHRRLITEKDVFEYYRVVEMPAYWRNLLMKISYQPLTRVDARRMYDMGVLNDQELLNTYLDEGYNDINAQRMVEYTKRYSLDNDKDLSKSQIEDYYKNGLMSRNDAIDYLVSLHYRKEHAEMIIDRVDSKEEQEIFNAEVDIIVAQYLEHIIDRATAIAQLATLGVEQRKINLIIKKADSKIIKSTPLPSKEDILAFYSRNIIDEEKTISLLQQHGYTMENISYYLQLAKK